MAITYDSICNKLGFDPMKDKIKYGNSEDDTKRSRFSVLSLEEHEYLANYILTHTK